MQNFYFMWIQQNWEHDNFEKLRNFRFGKFRKESYFPWISPISFEPSRIETSSILRKWKELQNWELLVESHICLLAKITNTTISTDKHTSRINSEGNIFFCIFLMIINFRSINDEKIWETWDLKNYINNYIFSPNSSYFLRIQQNWGHDNFEKIERTQKILRDIPKKMWKIRALEKSQISSFSTSQNVRVLFENQKKSEKWSEKRWEFKKKIEDQFRKTVENERFGKISHFLINVPKRTENLRKCLKKFWEILNQFLRKSEKICKKIWEIFLPGMWPVLRSSKFFSQ